MPINALSRTRTTIAEFETFLQGRVDDARSWELVGGQISAMTNPTDVHEQIVGTVGVALKQAADARGCQAFFGGLRVQRSDDARGLDKPRPDLLVRCGQLTGRNYATDPLVVVEVLSPSTAHIDCGEKLQFYKTLPSLRQIALVDQDQVRIDLYRRTDTDWERETLTSLAQTLYIEAIGAEVSLRQVYFGTGLDCGAV